MARNDSDASRNSGGASANWVPCAEQNVCGSREMRRTSS